MRKLIKIKFYTNATSGVIEIVTQIYFVLHKQEDIHCFKISIILVNSFLGNLHINHVK